MFDAEELDRLRQVADLPGLMRAEGGHLSASAGGFRSSCPLHGGDNPTAFSLFLDARKAWRWKCHSHDCGSGDSISYLQKRHGMSFVEAVQELARFSGFSLNSESDPNRTWISRESPRPPQASPVTFNHLDEKLQVNACQAFLAILKRIPHSLERGMDYALQRGIPMDVCRNMGGAWYVEDSDFRKITRWLDGDERQALRESFLAAGLLKQKENGLRMNWWGSVVLFPCMTIEQQPIFFTGRRLEWTDGERIGKYIHQSTANGSRLHCYGLPSIFQASQRGETLHIVEGVFDCLGAHALGMQAIAMLRRPEAKGWTDQASSSIKALEPYLKYFRTCASIDVVPDNDPGESGSIGQRKAEGLVSWLRGLGLDSSVVSLDELGFSDCKDLGDAAMRKRDV